MNNLNNALTNGRLVKIIAGIGNTNMDNIANVVNAAQAANAVAIDVAATPEIVKLARQNFNGILFASSTNANALAEAIANGADVAEIGNFDAFYANGDLYSYNDVLTLTKETLALLPEGTPLCVTVPGYLMPNAQQELARELEALGVTMLQSEGIHKGILNNNAVAHLSAEQKAQQTFNNTRVLKEAVNLPIMTASGINANNVNDAFNAGASAVGVGSAINNLNTVDAMTAEITATLNAANQANNASSVA